MAKKPVNQGKAWTDKQEASLKNLNSHNTPTDLMAYELGRSESAIYNKAGEMGISLKPVNKHPDKGHGRK